MCHERHCLKFYEARHELTRSRMHICFVTSWHLEASARNLSPWKIEQNVSGHLHPPSGRPNGKVQKLSWSLALTFGRLTTIPLLSKLSRLHSLGPSAWLQFWQPRSGVGSAWTSLDLGLMLPFGAFFFSPLPLSVLYIFFDLLQGAGVEASKTGWHPLASADYFL